MRMKRNLCAVLAAVATLALLGCGSYSTTGGSSTAELVNHSGTTAAVGAGGSGGGSNRFPGEATAGLYEGNSHTQAPGSGNHYAVTPLGNGIRNHSIPSDVPQPMVGLR